MVVGELRAAKLGWKENEAVNEGRKRQKEETTGVKKLGCSGVIAGRHVTEGWNDVVGTKSVYTRKRGSLFDAFKRTMRLQIGEELVS